MSDRKWYVGVLGVTILVSGCASPQRGKPPVYEHGKPAESPSVAYPLPDTPAPVAVPLPESSIDEDYGVAGDSPASGQPAVVALVSRADNQARSGDLNAAAASLERALRINPRDAQLWHRLADVRLQQRQFWEVEGLAAKSNSLARSDLGLQARNWRLIAAARRGQDDLVGAREAEQRAAAMDARVR